MKNNEYSLQFLNHAEVFETRDLAIQYINEYFKNNALLGEPALVFYGESRQPNMIMAVGSGEKKVFMIDTANIEQNLTEVSNTVDLNKEEIERINKALKNTIKVCGLIVDENKKENQISYEPNSKDALISDCETIADAVGIISEYAQKMFAETALSVANTNSVSLSYEDAVKGGKELKANVKVSVDGENDDYQYNDNIIGIKSDGLFASANLWYDEDKHQLTFTTSGIKNGRFVDDANKKIISLGEHTQYTPDNINHTVNLSVNSDKNTISGDVKISEDSDNILVVKDGRLFVDGRAVNIKYKGKTVYEGLNKLEENVAQIEHDINVINKTHFVEGSTTDTMVITSTKQPLGNYRLEGGVRLGSNQTIKVQNGGLEIDVDVTTDPIAGKLTLRTGNVTKEVALPSVSIVDNIYYDGHNKQIVVTINGGEQITIPVGDLVKDWEVNNSANSPIILTRNTGEPKDKLSADLRLAPTNNILQIDSNGNLIAPKNEITDAVAEETARAKDAEEKLQANINSAIETAEAQHTELDKKISDNAKAIAQEKADRIDADAEFSEHVATAERRINNLTTVVTETTLELSRVRDDVNAAKINIDANKTSIEKNVVDINSIKSDVSRIDTQVTKNTKDIQSNATIIGNNSDAIAENASKITNIDNRLITIETSVGDLTNDLADEVSDRKLADENIVSAVTANTNAINVEKERAIAKESELSSSIQTVAGSLINEQTRAQQVEAQLSDRITSNADAIAVLNGDVTTAGSVREIVNHSVEHLEGEISNEVSARTAGDADLQNKIDVLTTSTTEGITNALNNAKAYTDAEVRKHIVDTENAIANAKREAIDEAADDATAKSNKALADAKAYTDLETQRAISAEKINSDAIVKLQEKDIEIDGELAKKIESVVVKKNEINEYQYSILVDGVSAGEINIPKDEFLQDVSYDSVSKKLTFIFVTADGQPKNIEINVADLIDTYEAGNGIVLNDNVFSVKVNPASEYLSVDADGVKVSGINAALDLKADKDNVYSRHEAEQTFLSKTDAEALAVKTEVAADIKAVDDKVVALDGRVSKNEGAINILAGNNEVDGSVANAIKVSKEYADGLVSTESDRAKAAEKVNADAIAIINGNEAQDGSIKKALEDAKDYTNSKVLDESNARVNAINAINTELANKANVGDSYTKAESDAKYLTSVNIENFADSADVTALENRMDAAETSIATLKGNDAVDGSVANAIKVSKTHTDAEISKVNEVISTLATKEALKAEETARSEKDAAIDSELAKKINTVTIEKDAESDLTYNLFVDGVVVSKISIPEDQFLKSVNYDAGNKQLVFVFTTSDGDKTTNVPVDDLIDTYTAGNGLTLSASNEFVVKVDSASESYLTVSAEGVKVSGIDAALNLKANASDVYTKDESDAKFIIDADLADMKANIEANADAIKVINSTDLVEGSIVKAVDDAKKYADNAVAAEATIARKAEKDNADAIAIINGEIGLEGSIKHAVNEAEKRVDAKLNAKANSADVYTKVEVDNKVSTLATKTELLSETNRAKGVEGTKSEGTSISANTLWGAVEENAATLATKANAADVYTKDEADATFLKSVSFDGYATDEELAAEKARAEAAEQINAAAIAQNVSDIEAVEQVNATQTVDINNLKSEVVRLNLTASETNTVKTNVSKTDSGTTINSDVKVNSEAANIIKVNGNGIYANVSMSYNKATNVITFDNGNGAIDLQLSDHSIVTDGRYDSTNKTIVLTITNTDGSKHDITIPIGDLVKTWEVVNTTDNPIVLNKTVTSDGTEQLRATLNISTNGDNGLLDDNGTLFVSKNAKDLIALWPDANGSGTTSNQAVQGILDSLRTGVMNTNTRVDGIDTRLTTAEGDIQSLETSVAEAREEVAAMGGKVDAFGTTLADYSTRISTVENTTNNLVQQFNTISDEFDVLKTTVNTYETRIASLESQIATINESIGETVPGQPTVAERLTAIEEEIAKLIDFGQYTSANAENNTEEDTETDTQNLW